MQEADDMILVLLADRIARELLLEDDMEVRVEVVAEVEADHVRTRRHDLAHIEVGEVKDVVDEVRLRVVDEPLLVTLLHEQADFLLRVRLLAVAVRLEAEPVRDPVRDMVEQPDERIHDALEDEHGQRDGQHDFLDALDGHRLRRELAEHDMAARDDGERERERDGVPDGVRESERLRDGQDERRDGRLADPAEAEGGERDAELRDRERGVEMIAELFRVNRALVPLLDERLQARRTDLHDGELRRNEKTVHENEERDEHELHEDRHDVHGCKLPPVYVTGK